MKCKTPYCEAEARYLPVITYAIAGEPVPTRGEVYVMLPVCEEHAVYDEENLIPDHAYASLCEQCAAKGCGMPVRESIGIRFADVLLADVMKAQ